MRNLIAFSIIALVFTSCSSGADKRIVVMSKGPAEINSTAKTIKAKDGSGHEETDLVLDGGKVTLALSSPAGDANVDIAENGLWVVNVKNDTIIGSYQQYGDPKLARNMVTQDKVKQDLDSLRLLVEGKNVSAARRNFYILPNHATKLSDNIKADIVGPYHRMRSAEKVDGKDPEIYRFYSIKEIREMIVKYEGLTAPILK